ncbi:small integral membrane protein 3 [Cricetulus griseus]
MGQETAKLALSSVETTPARSRTWSPSTFSTLAGLRLQSWGRLKLLDPLRSWGPGKHRLLLVKPKRGSGSDRGANMDAISQSPVDVLLPKHILDIWAIVLIILATIVIMTSLFLCPATAVIIYRMRTHPVLNGAV